LITKRKLVTFIVSEDQYVGKGYSSGCHFFKMLFKYLIFFSVVVDFWLNLCCEMRWFAESSWLNCDVRRRNLKRRYWNSTNIPARKS